MPEKIKKSDGEWRSELASLKYAGTGESATEPPFTGRYWNCHDDGSYGCVCCGAPLFSAGTKFDSGSGWPSFWDPLDAGNLKLVEDHSHGMHRVEVKCARCDAHLGHLFPDGPPTTGMRYCINSASQRLAPPTEKTGG